MLDRVADRSLGRLIRNSLRREGCGHVAALAIVVLTRLRIGDLGKWRSRMGMTITIVENGWGDAKEAYATEELVALVGLMEALIWAGTKLRSNIAVAWAKEIQSTAMGKYRL